MATDIYVDGLYGDDSNSGFDWTNAKKTITGGLALSHSLSGPDSVHVTEGKYYENIDLVYETTLLGGYPNGGGARNASVHITIINGSSGPSTYKTAVNGASNAVIDGFTITGGSTPGGYVICQGGGITCFGTSPTITNNIITGNYVRGNDDFGTGYGGPAEGAGIFCVDSSAVIKGNTIINNSVRGGPGGYKGTGMGGHGSGAGIYCQDSYCTITENIFEDNSKGR